MAALENMCDLNTEHKYNYLTYLFVTVCVKTKQFESNYYYVLQHKIVLF